MIFDFMDRRRLVQVAGLRLVCRRPTVATIAELSARFSAEIAAGRAAHEESNGELDWKQVVVQAAERFAQQGDPRVAAVLSHCVEGLDPEQSEPAVLSAVVRGVLSTCDLERIADGFGDDSGGSGDAADHGLDPGDAGLLRVAQSFHVAPGDVLQWPYEALLRASDYLVAQDKALEAARKGGRTGPSVNVRDPDMNIPGLGRQSIGGTRG